MKGIWKHSNTLRIPLVYNNIKARWQQIKCNEYSVLPYIYKYKKILLKYILYQGYFFTYLSLENALHSNGHSPHNNNVTDMSYIPRYSHESGLYFDVNLIYLT